MEHWNSWAEGYKQCRNARTIASLSEQATLYMYMYMYTVVFGTQWECENSPYVLWRVVFSCVFFPNCFPLQPYMCTHKQPLQLLRPHQETYPHQRHNYVHSYSLVAMATMDTRLLWWSKTLHYYDKQYSISPLYKQWVSPLGVLTVPLYQPGLAGLLSGRQHTHLTFLSLPP